MFSKSTIRLDRALIARAAAEAEKAGYSSVDEFIRHVIEKELARREEAESKDQVLKQLKGLGYLE